MGDEMSTVARDSATADTSIATALSQAETFSDVIVECARLAGNVAASVERDRCVDLAKYERGDAAMKSASRNAGVMVGGMIGVSGGSTGMIAGGIAAGAVLDGITTGVESALKGEFKPSGQIKAWNDVAVAKDAPAAIAGVLEALMTPIRDGVVGYEAGKVLENQQVDLHSKKFKSIQQGSEQDDGEGDDMGGI